jgi:omega-3 fatty acid desaturase (delta-15 desaturase)
MPKNTGESRVKSNEVNGHSTSVKEGDVQIPAAPSLTDIKTKIPETLFKPTLLKSYQYVFQDIAMVAGLFLLMYVIQDIQYVNMVMWPLYWFFQGTLFWSFFVLGHDCGHGSFSRHKWVNHATGTVLHSFILVPYHMWRISHRHHHKNTGNWEKDEIFYPEPAQVTEAPTTARSIMTRNYFYLGLGFAIYLVYGYPPRQVSHFNLNDPLFKDNFKEVFSSLVGWWTMVACLTYFGYTYGAATVGYFYLVPWLIFSSWLVITTFLHHNEPGVPWFNNKNWNYVIGNLSSVDRDYGFLHKITHDIGTHQVHHLFPAIPHYNLQEATKYFRNAYPHLVRKVDTPILPTFFRNCRIFAEQHIFSGNPEVFAYTEILQFRKNVGRIGVSTFLTK